MRDTRLIAALAALVFAASCGDSRELITGADLTVLKGATLIDGTGEAPRSQSVVVIKGKQITRVGRVDEWRFGQDVAIQDLTGLYITPGFIDLHVHPRLGAEEATMRMLLAFGITTIRIPGVGFESPDDLGLRLRTRVASGNLDGPRVFTGGKIIEGPHKTFPTDVEVRSVDEVRKEVRRQAAEGVDLVKLYWSTPVDFVRAAVDEAHAHGIQVIGHLRATSWTQAAAAGIDGLVHSAADGCSWELVPAETVLALRRESPRRYFERLAELIDLKASQFDTLVSELVQNHVTVDPTLVIMQSLYYGDDLSVLNQLEPNSAPPSVQATWGLDWQLANPVLKRDAGTKDLPYGKHLFARALEIVREFHRRGVRVAIGTDVGMPWITPGVSLHREMQLMVEAGIPPREVLLLATKNGAEGLKSAKKFGTIAPGMSADIVVLRADPTADIRNTRSIESVYREGRKFDPRALLSQLR